MQVLASQMYCYVRKLCHVMHQIHNAAATKLIQATIQRWPLLKGDIYNL